MSFFGSLFGFDQQHAIEGAKDKSDQARLKGYNDATGNVSSYYGKAMDQISPYVTGGLGAYKTYSDTLGLNGDAARKAAQQGYLGDDVLAQITAQQLKRSNNAANAGGSVNSGAAALANSRTMLGGYGDWQNKLAGLASGGAAAAQFGAGLTSQTGSQLGSLAMGYGTGQATEEQQYGQNMAGAMSILPNTLIGLAGTAIKGFTPTTTAGGLTPFGGMTQTAGAIPKMWGGQPWWGQSWGAAGGSSAS